jgi:hypothetical protein
MRRAKDERGTISAFVVVLVLACLMAAGLALDGGRIVAARVQVTDIAGNAARAAAQQVDGLRSGAPALDPNRARAAAQHVLEAAGATGSVDVRGTSVTVTATTDESLLLLRLVGISHRTVSATATARAEAGT